MMPVKLLFRIRCLIGLFVLLLVLSGVTAFPVYSEMQWAADHHLFSGNSPLDIWMNQVWQAINDTNTNHAILFYGYDWLAFAHIVIGMAFIGPFKDPIRNKWVIEWAMLACGAVIPLALIAGTVRHIPWFHIVIDCSFGIIGIVPLLVVWRWIYRLEIIQGKPSDKTIN